MPVIQYRRQRPSQTRRVGSPETLTDRAVPQTTGLAIYRFAKRSSYLNLSMFLLRLTETFLVAILNSPSGWPKMGCQPRQMIRFVGIGVHYKSESELGLDRNTHPVTLCLETTSYRRLT